MSMVSKMVGKQGEEAASRFLEGLGYRILDRNVLAHGAGNIRLQKPGKIISELDIVAQQEDILVFVEVKTRRSLRCGTPLESITPRKVNQLRLAAECYIRQHCLEGWAMRIDAISVTLQPEGWTLRHIKGIG